MRRGFNLWVGKIPWRRKWQPAPVFLLGKFHGQRNLVGYSPWGHKDLDTTERLSTTAGSLLWWNLPGVSVKKNPPANAGDAGLIP